eukprot:scaffold3719_cov247-Pinguiococcus_pyrenoidosus.AAC.23
MNDLYRAFATQALSLRLSDGPDSALKQAGDFDAKALRMRFLHALYELELVGFVKKRKDKIVRSAFAFT